ncbi:universal stress protein [Bradyrhizobium barranii subsp. barranii]|uniref:Universal stress protein n=1 Tax=Bradyrhizobium barranii subsp. barranii TaxID=2823807 RepID=A0A7Z0TWZ8_9BRAD|nr:universal stress protein [Bradyrhizobium barranii]UGX97974.1 universal stress protein [Bradyrhizobium barranii subsp. barranii]
MTIATVMVYVDPEQQAEGQVRIARDVANKFEASLIGVSAFAVEPPFVAEGVIIQETTADGLKRMKSALSEKEQWFRHVAGLPKERVEWRCSVEYPTVFLSNEARSADLVVSRCTQEKMDQFHFIDPAEAMMRMGRPTLMVPDHVPALNADHILVGWKDTREARIAVRDALPFLSRASQVTVIEICTSDEQDTARRRVRDVAKNLQSHAVKCQVEVRVHMAEPDAHQLVRVAKDKGADLIVTGGYGHSRELWRNLGDDGVRKAAYRGG